MKKKDLQAFGFVESRKKSARIRLEIHKLFTEKYTPEEIAEELGIGVDAVRGYLGLNGRKVMVDRFNDGSDNDDEDLI